MPYIPGKGTIEDVFSSPDVFTNNVPTALHLPPNVEGVFIDGIFLPNNPYQAFHAATLLSEAGSNAPHDDPDSDVQNYGDTPASQDRLFPPEFRTDPALGLEIPEKEEIEFEGESPDRGAPVICGTYATDPIDYNQPLSANYTIKSLSIGAVFAHNIVAQNGLSVADIICNLKGVAENILEPLRRQFPGPRINSAFRKGVSGSQHNKGMAVDIQWPGIKPSEYTARAQWVRANLPYDQLIFEHGNSIWLHISYNRTTARQRNALLTYYPRVRPQYKPGLTNYYDDAAA